MPEKEGGDEDSDHGNACNSAENDGGEATPHSDRRKLLRHEARVTVEIGPELVDPSIVRMVIHRSTPCAIERALAKGGSTPRLYCNPSGAHSRRACNRTGSGGKSRLAVAWT